MKHGTAARGKPARGKTMREYEFPLPGGKTGKVKITENVADAVFDYAGENGLRVDEASEELLGFNLWEGPDFDVEGVPPESE